MLPIHLNLLKESQSTDPRAPGGSSFRLQAKIKVFEGENQSEDGAYAFFWTGQNRWREEFSIGNFQQARVGGDGGTWETRSVPFIPYRLWQLSQALAFYARLSPLAAQRVGKVESKVVSGVKLRCVEVSLKTYQYRDLCFAANSPQLVLEPVIPNRWYYFSDYAPLGTRELPKKISVFDGQSRSSELVVVELQDSVQIDPSTFDHSSDAHWRPWCASPEPNDHLSPIYSLQVPGLGVATVYMAFGTDGRIQNARILKSSGPERDALILEALKREKWERPTCGGRPVELETVALR